MTNWEGWKLPDNWREILDDEIEKADRYFSRLIEESDETEETKELARQIVDPELDNLRRGTSTMLVVLCPSVEASGLTI